MLRRDLPGHGRSRKECRLAEILWNHERNRGEMVKNMRARLDSKTRLTTCVESIMKQRRSFDEKHPTDPVSHETISPEDKNRLRILLAGGNHSNQEVVREILKTRLQRRRCGQRVGSCPSHGKIRLRSRVHKLPDTRNGRP